VNGFSQVGQAENVDYYDAPHFADFWKSAAALGKPFYLHPRDPLPSREPIYDGFPWLTAATWAFAVETSIHALRLMSSGLFDRNPGLQMILGHLGEGIPFNIWRVDHIVRKAPRGIPCRREIGDYLRENVYITTSGNFRTPSLLSTMLEVGSDRIMYSVDYPLRPMRTRPAGSTIARSAKRTGRRSGARTRAACSAYPELTWVPWPKIPRSPGQPRGRPSSRAVATGQLCSTSRA
jgi:predicted TIM-barrel fold metal-dependent hydrolase